MYLRIYIYTAIVSVRFSACRIDEKTIFAMYVCMYVLHRYCVQIPVLFSCIIRTKKHTSVFLCIVCVCMSVHTQILYISTDLQRHASFTCMCVCVCCVYMYHASVTCMCVCVCCMYHASVTCMYVCMKRPWIQLYKSVKGMRLPALARKHMYEYINMYKYINMYEYINMWIHKHV